MNTTHKGCDSMNEHVSLFEQDKLDPVAEAVRLQTLVDDLERRLSQAYARMRLLEDKLQQIDAFKREIQALRSELDARYGELAVLATIASTSDPERPKAHATEIPRSSADRLLARVRGVVRRGGGFKRDVSLVRLSGLFDESWYQQRYPDVVEAGLDPVEHYVAFGAAEGRDPSSSFSTSQYRLRNPHIERTGVNPLVHYIQSSPSGKPALGKSGF